MKYWLLKSEPFKYAWADLVNEGKTNWDGVRNYQARNYLKEMIPGDLALFYHSNEGKEVVGIARISAPAIPDPQDESGKWVMIEVAPWRSLKNPVSLNALRTDPLLGKMDIFRQMRLSVTQVKPDEFEAIVALGGLDFESELRHKNEQTH